MTFEEAVQAITSGKMSLSNYRETMAAVADSDLPIPADFAQRVGQPAGTTWREYAEMRRTAAQRRPEMSPSDWFQSLGAIALVIAGIIVAGLVLFFVLTVLPKDLLGPALVGLVGLILVGRIAARRF